MAENGTIAYIDHPKYCDFSHPEPTEARYDFKTQRGPWANGCVDHYFEHRLFGSLGLGKGQKLELRGVARVGEAESPEEHNGRTAPVGGMTVPPNEHDSSDLV